MPEGFGYGIFKNKSEVDLALLEDGEIKTVTTTITSTDSKGTTTAEKTTTTKEGEVTKTKIETKEPGEEEEKLPIQKTPLVTNAPDATIVLVNNTNDINADNFSLSIPLSNVINTPSSNNGPTSVAGQTPSAAVTANPNPLGSALNPYVTPATNGVGTQNIIASTVNFNMNIALEVDGYLKLPKVKDKASPGDLSEYINANTDGVGCILFVIDEDGKFTQATNKFLITNMSINYKERYQVMEAFNSVNVSFFGEAAKVYSFQGVAVDWGSDSKYVYKNFHQSSLIKLYNDEMRGTKLIENNKIAAIQIVNHFITGYPLNFNVQYSSANDKMAQFSMSWVVKDHTLSYAGTFTEKQLTESYKPYSDNSSLPYIQNIEATIDKLNTLLLFGKNLRLAKSGAFPYIEVDDMLAISIVKLQVMPNSVRTNFNTTLTNTVNFLFNNIKASIVTSNVISPLIVLYLKIKPDNTVTPPYDFKDFDMINTNMISLIPKLTQNNEYSSFMNHVAALQNFKKILIAHKARLIY